MPFIPLRERQTLIRAQHQADEPTAFQRWWRLPRAKLCAAIFTMMALITAMLAIGVAMNPDLPSLLILGFFVGATLLPLGLPVFLAAGGPSGKKKELLALEVSLERAQRVALAIQTATNQKANLRQLIAYLQWTEEAVVDGLGTALERGLLLEDYDSTTRHYVYIWPDALFSSASDFESFDARLQHGQEPDVFPSQHAAARSRQVAADAVSVPEQSQAQVHHGFWGDEH